jgi:tetratricopeptide (TPR) repeat protein
MLQNNEILIDLLDHQLSPEETTRVNGLISGNKETAAEWEYLKMAVEAIELGAIREQVMQARQSFRMQATSTPRATGGVIRSLYRNALRVAAVLVLLMGVSVVYKYNTVSNQSVFQEGFTEYSLNTSRGAQHQDALEDAYRNKNWSAVTTLFQQESTKTNKSYFLAGMAAMELKNYGQAVADFENILQLNSKTGDNYFQYEAEYYLSLAYLMNGQTDKGIALLTQIRGNKNHPYNQQALQVSATDLKVIQLKK